MAQSIAIESQRLYSLKEFEELDLPNTDTKYELIDGELVVTPPAGFQHGSISAKIVKRINLFDPDDKLGIVLQDTGFQVAPGFGPIPDVAFLITANVPPRDTQGYGPGAARPGG